MAYCSKECQKSAWKAQKLVCKKQPKKGEEGYEKKTKLYLTWAQLETYGDSVPATGKTIELKIIDDQSMMRQVMGCMDREGIVKRVACYNNARSIPEMKVGSLMRWKNPRFHYFMDGSSGARIEESDVPNIVLTKV